MSRLLSTVAGLALVAALVQPAQAEMTGKTWATGCLNESRGTIDRLNLFRSTPKSSYTSEQRQITIMLEQPGLAFAKRRATILTQIGSVDLISGPQFAPFVVRLQADETDCLIEVAALEGRLFSPNPEWRGVRYSGDRPLWWRFAA